MTELRIEAIQNWHEGLLGFLADCEASEEADEAERIADALVLFSAAPDRVRPNWRQLPTPAALQAMCAVGASESAALSLIGESMGFLLSRGANGRFLASVVLSGSEDDHCSEGRTAALAMLSALALALLGSVPIERRQRPRDTQVPASRLN